MYDNEMKIMLIQLVEGYTTLNKGAILQYSDYYAEEGPYFWMYDPFDWTYDPFDSKEIFMELD